MKNMGKYSIYLTGSRKTIQRSVYEENGKYFIKFYGQYIEVVRNWSDYCTVEKY